MHSVAAVVLMVGTIFLTGCGKHESPNFVFMPDMDYSPALKAQEEGSMRKPVPGTVPRGFYSADYTVGADPIESGKLYKNPLPRNKKTLQRGQLMYSTYCTVCHGPMGEGDGTVVPKFPRPPSLQSDKIRGYADGGIYHVITKGQNLMPSYTYQVGTQDRWAIVHYIRALHRAKKPTAEDLKAFDSEN